MSFQLAQLNVARFMQPREHPANKDFIDNLDRVNAEAERQPGFVWRLVDEDSNDATDIQAFDDDNMIVNLSVWQNLESLSEFVYRNKVHRAIMRRRAEWFSQMQVYLVLWWVEQGHIPTVAEALGKLRTLEQHGPSAAAFTFKSPFPPPESA